MPSRHRLKGVLVPPVLLLLSMIACGSSEEESAGTGGAGAAGVAGLGGAGAGGAAGGAGLGGAGSSTCGLGAGGTALQGCVSCGGKLVETYACQQWGTRYIHVIDSPELSGKKLRDETGDLGVVAADGTADVTSSASCFYAGHVYVDVDGDGTCGAADRVYLLPKLQSTVCIGPSTTTDVKACSVNASTGGAGAGGGG